ncbi:2-keto-4-pentenoate hydratase [Salinibacterium sp. GXW1014]|uniref:2-keto-4-pentenoate hydratase n=1 Tax=Salinibacterium sp. GXW1014 TaxID=3377838 RepID=UPI00383A22F7
MTEVLDLQRVADLIDGAQVTGTAIEQFGEALELRDAYAVQRRLLAMRETRGETLTGVKLGFTSIAKMQQMGVDEIIVGFLTDRMLLADRGSMVLDGLVHPRVEPEVAFRLGRRVEPDGSAAELVDAIDAVAPALEVIDSRYRDFRFSLTDVVADNTSAAYYAVGTWQPFRRDLEGLAVTLFADGAVADTGTTSAILGHPLHAVERLARMLPEVGRALDAGSIILAGAATAAVAVGEASDVSAVIAGLGQVEIHVDRERQAELNENGAAHG